MFVCGMHVYMYVQNMYISIMVIGLDRGLNQYDVPSEVSFTRMFVLESSIQVLDM